MSSLDLFYSVSGMCISLIKSSFLFNDVDDKTCKGISTVLSLNMEHIDGGFNYLGYRLNPLGYGVNDRRWIIKRFGKKNQSLVLQASFLGRKVNPHPFSLTKDSSVLVLFGKNSKDYIELFTSKDLLFYVG